MNILVKQWNAQGFNFQLSRNPLDKPISTSAGPSGNGNRFYLGIKIHEYVTLHRKELPANINSSEMHWYKDGKRHNLHGPAQITTIHIGTLYNYYIGGNELSKCEWEVERLKYLKKTDL